MNDTMTTKTPSQRKMQTAVHLGAGGVCSCAATVMHLASTCSMQSEQLATPAHHTAVTMDQASRQCQPLPVSAAYPRAVYAVALCHGMAWPTCIVLMLCKGLVEA